MTEGRQTPIAIESGFILRHFVGSAGLLSLGSIATFARAVVTAKLFAVTLGPSLVGILAQLFNFSALVSVIVPLGLTTGVVKMVAEVRHDDSATNRVVGSACVLSLASGFFASIVLLPASAQISLLLTGSTQWAGLVALIVLSFPLYNLAGTLSYILQGLSEVRMITRANVANAALSLVILVPATLTLGLLGAVLTVLVTSLLQFTLFGVEVLLAYRLRGWRLRHVRPGRAESQQLLRFGLILLAGSVAIWASLLVVRTQVVQSLGQYQNGLYQAVYGLSNQEITVFMTWMAAYVVPRIANQGSRDLNHLLTSGLRANLFLMVPVLTLGVALRQPLVHIFYSSQFLPAASLIPMQALGDYLRVVGWSMAAALFPLGHTRAHLALIVCQSVLWVALTALLLPILHLAAVSVAYANSFLPWAPAAYLLLHRWYGIGLSWESAGLMACGLLCVVTATISPQWLGVISVPLMPLVVLATGRYKRSAVSAADHQ